MEQEIKKMIKEEINKILLREYSCIFPYKENLKRIVEELSKYYEYIKQDIIARKNIGDDRASLHDSLFIEIGRNISNLCDNVNKIGNDSSKTIKNDII